MTHRTAAVLWALLALGGSVVPRAHAQTGVEGREASAATARHPDRPIGPGAAVPFLSQGPLLCGGAAAAMVERFWGARGVYAEDYEHLVREREGGIRTSELAGGLRARGYAAHVIRSDPRAARSALADGVPPILLLGTGRRTLHYVVLVSLGPETALVHDPNDGPSRALPRDELERRWAESGYWTLVARPSGVGAAASDEASATRGTASARTRPAAVERGLTLLRAGDAAGARRAVGDLLDGRSRQPDAVTAEDEALARRVLATALYLDDEPVGALAEWNVLGEPRIDLVVVEGTSRLRHRVATDRMGLRHGTLLTPTALATARRRLLAVPAVRDARVGYAPLPDGSAEVRASVLEHDPWPGRLTMALQGGRALVTREASLSFGPYLGAGDRWDVGGAWDGARRYAALSLRTPTGTLPGIVEVTADWRAERFAFAAPVADAAPGPGTEEERVRATLGLSDWVGPTLELGGALGVERWSTGVRTVSARASAEWLLASGAMRVAAEAEGWTGADRFAHAGIELDAERPAGTGRAWLLRLRADVVSERTPRTLWPGAGTGQAREGLLRGHPLVVEDAIGGPALGRGLLAGTLEHRILHRVGPVRVGASVFVDAARVWRTAPGWEERGWVDPGVSLLALIDERVAALSLARGDDTWVLSARVSSRR